ncbi:MAG: polysaccharide biosynthesis protein [Litorilinea sp.]|nr:MAG: polysaccharide biosynthesis protein [Litorilinea sp.]
MQTTPTSAGVVQSTGRRVLVNTGALTSSSLWRIALSFVLQVLIARGLGVAALGQYTVAMAYLNVSQVISELGLPVLLVRDLAQMPTRRRAYFRTALWVQMASALLTWGGLVLLTLVLPFSASTRPALWLVGASLPFFAVTSVCETLFQAGERMELVMGIEMLVNLLIVAVSLVALWLGGEVLHLIGVLILTQLFSALLCLWLVGRSGLLAEPQEGVAVSPRMLFRQAPPFLGLTLADVLLQRMDILLLSVLGGETMTGLYSAAYNLVRVALKLIQSFGRALYPTFSRLRHQALETYHRLAALSLRYGLLILLPAAALGTALAPDLLHLVYAQDYVQAAPIFQVLLWLPPLFLLETYAVTLLMVERHPGHSLLISGLHVGVLLVAMPPLIWVGGAQGAAWAVLLAGGAGVLGSLWFLRGKRLAPALGQLWPMGAASALALVLAIWLPMAWPWRLLASAALYALLAWFTGMVAPDDIQLFRRVLRHGKG